jgi:hypothetical protein
VPGEPAPQVEIVCVGVSRRSLRRHRRRRADERAAHPRDDRARDLFLDREDVVGLAVVYVGPQAIAALRADQLRGDAQLASRLAHAPLDHRVDAELAADLADIHRLLLVGEHGSAGRDLQSLDCAERGDELFGHPVAEVLVLGLDAAVGERQHGNRSHRIS